MDLAVGNEAPNGAIRGVCYVNPTRVESDLKTFESGDMAVARDSSWHTEALPQTETWTATVRETET